MAQPPQISHRPGQGSFEREGSCGVCWAGCHCPAPALWVCCPCPGPFSLFCPGEAGLAEIGQVARLNFALLSLIARVGFPPPGSALAPTLPRKSAIPSADPSAMNPKTDFFSEKLREHNFNDVVRGCPQTTSRRGPGPFLKVGDAYLSRGVAQSKLLSEKASARSPLRKGHLSGVQPRQLARDGPAPTLRYELRRKLNCQKLS